MQYQNAEIDSISIPALPSIPLGTSDLLSTRFSEKTFIYYDAQWYRCLCSHCEPALSKYISAGINDSFDDIQQCIWGMCSKELLFADGPCHSEVENFVPLTSHL